MGKWFESNRLISMSEVRTRKVALFGGRFHMASQEGKMCHDLTRSSGTKSSKYTNIRTKLTYFWWPMEELNQLKSSWNKILKDRWGLLSFRKKKSHKDKYPRSWEATIGSWRSSLWQQCVFFLYSNDLIQSFYRIIFLVFQRQQ